MQSARRRLKYLYHHKFVGRVVPYVQIGSGMPETAYLLDREGVGYLKGLNRPVRLWKKASRVKHHFLQHALYLSEFRLVLEIALRDQRNLHLDTFIADFEIKSETKGRERYKLYSELIHSGNRQSYVVYPDALIILEWSDGTSSEKSLYFVEIDRGTEGLERIRDKVIGYSLYAKQKMFEKYGKFNPKYPFRVLIQTSSEKRAKNIRTALVDQENSSLIWVTDNSKISSESILNKPVWIDYQNNYKSLLK